MGLLSRIFTPSAVKGEGDVRPGPWLVDGGWLPASWGANINWWQNGYSPLPAAANIAIVEACVSAYSQTVAMCPSAHYRRGRDGGHETVTSSALHRVLRKPNSYQSTSDFLLNLVRALYLDGNAYSLALRNDRYEIVELHLMNSGSCSARVGITGEVFYSLGGNPVVDRLFSPEQGLSNALSAVPARDVLHVKLQTGRDILKGETPLYSAASNIAVSNLAVQQAIAMYGNQSRPSGVLQTDMGLTADQVAELRERWNQQSQGLNAGGTPILTNGLKWTPTTMKAEETKLIEVMKLTREDIALAFRVPLQILGIGGTPFASTEALNQSWLGSSLGFALNHVEEAFGNLFGLPGYPSEYMGFDTSALLRSNFAERMAGLAAAIKGGVFATNEARSSEGLPRVEFGDQVRVQQQDVPLSFWANPPEPEPEPAVPAEPAPVEESDDDAERAAVSNFRRVIGDASRRYAESIH